MVTKRTFFLPYFSGCFLWFVLLPIQNIINAVIDNTLTVSFCNNNFLTSFKDELKREGDETCKNNETRA